MERVLIVNADDFGLSKGQNYGIVEAYRNGVVTSTTALVNGEAIDHAAQLSRELPALGVGMHFVLTLGKPVSEMPGLTRDGLLGKWIWQMAEEDTLPLDELRMNWRVSISVSSTYLAASQRISTVTIMCICSRNFPHRRPLCGAARDCVTY